MNHRGPAKYLARMAALVASLAWLVGCAAPGAGERIACHVTQRENSDVAYPRTVLYIMNGDGSGRRQVGDGNQPTWSPDGSKLLSVLSTQHGLQTLDIDAGTTTLLVNMDDDIDAPTWSPDGSVIAFRVHYQSIWVISVDGAEARALASFGASRRVGRPSWSPAGAEIAFSLSRDGDNDDIYLMDRDGSDIVRLTDGTADYDSPIWSPTDDTIAFERSDNGEAWVCAMASDGSAHRCLAPGQPYGWSPDGTRIYFHMPFDDVLWTMNSDGSDRTRLFKLGCEDPAWSPVLQQAGRGDPSRVEH